MIPWCEPGLGRQVRGNAAPLGRAWERCSQPGHSRDGGRCPDSARDHGQGLPGTTSEGEQRGFSMSSPSGQIWGAAPHGTGWEVTQGSNSPVQATPPSGCLEQGPICPKSQPGLVCLSPLCSQSQSDAHSPPRAISCPFPHSPPELQHALWGRRRWSLCPFKTRRWFANASCSPATHAPLQCPFHAQRPPEQ